MPIPVPSDPSGSPMLNNQAQPSRKIFWVIGALIITMLAGGYYLYFKKNSLNVTYVPPIHTDKSIEDQQTNELAGADIESQLTYKAKNFYLSFDYPNGFDVIEGSNYIAIAQKPYKSYEEGDNAFFRLTKYDKEYSKIGLMSDYRAALANLTESKITLDGYTFPVFEGTILGGTAEGRIKVVFLNGSWLEISDDQSNSNFDPISIGEQILQSFRFSK